MKVNCPITKDTVLFEGRIYLVQGVQNKGAYVKLKERSKPVRTADVQIHRYGRGFRAV